MHTFMLKNPVICKIISSYGNLQGYDKWVSFVTRDCQLKLWDEMSGTNAANAFIASLTQYT